MVTERDHAPVEGLATRLVRRAPAPRRRGTMGRAEAPDAVDLRGDHQVGSDPLLQGQHLSLPLQRRSDSAFQHQRPPRIAPTLPERREKSGRRLTETGGPRIYVCDAAVYLPPSRP